MEGGRTERDRPTGRAGEDFEMQVEVDTRWVKPMGSRSFPSPKTALVRSLHRSMGKEAGGNIRRGGPGETSESDDLRRDTRGAAGHGRFSTGDIAGGSIPPLRLSEDREGTALVAKGRNRPEVAVEARFSATKAARGGGTPGGAIPHRRWRRSVEVNPRSAAPSQRWIGARSSEEQRVRGGRTPEAQTGRGWDPGAIGGRARAQAPRIGPFARLGRAVGDRNPMRGGSGIRSGSGARRFRDERRRPRRVMC